METMPGKVPQLPSDIFYLICAHASQKDLRSLRLANKDFEAAASSVFFAKVKHNFTDTGILWLKLLANSRHARHVKSLQLYWVWCEEDQYHDLGYTVPSRQISSSLCQNLKLLPNITALNLDFHNTCERESEERALAMDHFIGAAVNSPLLRLASLSLTLSAENEGDIKAFKSCLETYSQGWADMCRRLKKFEIVVVVEDNYVRGNESLDGTSHLLQIMNPMVALTDLAIWTCPHQVWPSSEIRLTRLQRLCLDHINTTAPLLKKLLSANHTTLKAVTLGDVNLIAGYWHEIFETLSQFPSLSHVALYMIGYDVPWSLEQYVLESMLIRRSKSWSPVLDSILWADWHALRDLIRGTQRKGSPRSQVPCEEYLRILRTYNSLNDYRNLPEYKDQRDADRARKSGQDPEGVEGPI